MKETTLFVVVGQASSLVWRLLGEQREEGASETQFDREISHQVLDVSALLFSNFSCSAQILELKFEIGAKFYGGGTNI